MKKILFLFMLMSLTLATHAQDSTRRVYCELLGTGRFMSTKVTVTVDFGQDDQGWNARLVDENGKPISFNSMVDAMNYMGRIGWKFEQAYVVTSSNQNVYHWLLSKDITDDEMINEGFKTRKDTSLDKKKKKVKKERNFQRSSGDDLYY